MSADWDVVVVGAGISGVDAAYRIQERLPGLTYTVLEARSHIGGTWDLFKYPGIRSDSDLITFGFPFHPWRGSKMIASGKSILEYMDETVRVNGIDKHIQFERKIVRAAWSSDKSHWQLTVESPTGVQTVTTRFMFLGTGYYDYASPLETTIPGLKNFQGKTIHPQFWPEELDYAGKDIVIVGSGATAVTLLPELAQSAKKVTMLQRSATYIASMPQRRPPVRWWTKYLSPNLSYQIIRLQLVFFGFLFYQFCRIFPERARKGFLKRVEAQLPEGMPLSPNFAPKYNLWDQRLCVSPNGEFFKCLRSGVADVKTAVIKTVTPTGILLETGEELTTDIIVTATGLRMKFAGGIHVSVDGQDVDLSKLFLWKGMMLQGIPNMAFAFGYGNASWTLGADVSALGFCRVVNYMLAKQYKSVTPWFEPGSVEETSSMVGLSSTYVKLGGHVMPRVGNKKPWMRRTNYLYDFWLTAWSNMTRGLNFA